MRSKKSPVRKINISSGSVVVTRSRAKAQRNFTISSCKSTQRKSNFWEIDNIVCEVDCNPYKKSQFILEDGREAFSDVSSDTQERKGTNRKILKIHEKYMKIQSLSKEYSRVEQQQGHSSLFDKPAKKNVAEAAHKDSAGKIVNKYFGNSPTEESRSNCSTIIKKSMRRMTHRREVDVFKNGIPNPKFSLTCLPQKIECHVSRGIKLNRKKLDLEKTDVTKGNVIKSKFLPKKYFETGLQEQSSHSFKLTETENINSMEKCGKNSSMKVMSSFPNSLGEQCTLTNCKTMKLENTSSRYLCIFSHFMKFHWDDILKDPKSVLIPLPKIKHKQKLKQMDWKSIMAGK